MIKFCYECYHYAACERSFHDSAECCKLATPADIVTKLELKDVQSQHEIRRLKMENERMIDFISELRSALDDNDLIQVGRILERYDHRNDD